jgi:hypothetical protein
MHWPRWGIPEEEWRDLARWQKSGLSVIAAGRALWYGILALFVIFAVVMVVLLIGSLAYHGLVKGDLGSEDGHGTQTSGQPLDPNPIKKNGQPSYEFEPDDIERAEAAPESLQRYCEGAVSEAQEIGCLSHVEPSEVP